MTYYPESSKSKPEQPDRSEQFELKTLADVVPVERYFNKEAKRRAEKRTGKYKPQRQYKEPGMYGNWKHTPPKREPLKVEDLTRNWPKQ